MSIRRRLAAVSPMTIAFALCFAAIMTYVALRVFAASGSATIYTNPGGTQSVSVGQTFAVTVRVSTPGGVPVTGASVYLAYPASKLQVLGQSYGGPYNTQLAASNSGGVLRMDRAAFPMIGGGDQVFAQVTFKALATGSAPISFTGSSLVTSGEDDSNILAGQHGVTYEITASAAASGGTSSSGSGTRASGGSTAGGSGGAASTGGNAASSGGAAAASSGSGGGSANAAAGAGETGDTTSSAQSAVAITIVDPDNKPVKDAVVTINGQTAKTDAKGIARFAGLPAGDLKVAVSYNGNKTSKIIQVKGAATTEAPEIFKVSIKKQKFNPWLLSVPIIFLVAAMVYILRPGRLRFAGAPSQPVADKIVTSGQPDTPPSPLGTVANPERDTPGTVFNPGQSQQPLTPETTVHPQPGNDQPQPPEKRPGG